VKWLGGHWPTSHAHRGLSPADRPLRDWFLSAFSQKPPSEPTRVLYRPASHRTRFLFTSPSGSADATNCTARAYVAFSRSPRDASSNTLGPFVRTISAGAVDGVHHGRGVRHVERPSLRDRGRPPSPGWPGRSLFSRLAWRSASVNRSRDMDGSFLRTRPRPAVGFSGRIGSTRPKNRWTRGCRRVTMATPVPHVP
jgi:hypothetical protein